MIQEIRITNVEEAMAMATDHQYDPKIDRWRSSYFYRGMPDASYDLVTSLTRNCDTAAKNVENAILRNFTKYASIDDPSLSNSIWKQMIVGQHHGLPTRLLDWTHSSLIALNFAMSENDLSMLSKRDCVIWRIDAKALNESLPVKYRTQLNKESTFMFSVDSLSSIVSTTQEYDTDMGSNSFVCLEPPSVDQRIINQYSFFTVMPAGITNISEFLDKHPSTTIKYVIDKEIRWKLRDILDQFNVNERMIYPGLDGLSKWIARHYYYKRKE